MARYRTRLFFRPCSISKKEDAAPELERLFADKGDIIKNQLTFRNVGMTFKQVATLRQGLPEDIAKKITKLLRDEYPKAKGQIQSGTVRITSKSKDELQRVIARLKEEGEGYPVALQFKNYR